MNEDAEEYDTPQEKDAALLRAFNEHTTLLIQSLILSYHPLYRMRSGKQQICSIFSKAPGQRPPM
jgi:hypothetical protein